MTPKDKIHVDDFLKSGFSGSGELPGAHVWLNIEREIATRNKKRMLVLFFVGLAYLAAILWHNTDRTGFGSSFKSETSKKQTSNQTVVKNKKQDAPLNNQNNNSLNAITKIDNNSETTKTFVPKPIGNGNPAPVHQSAQPFTPPPSYAGTTKPQDKEIIPNSDLQKNKTAVTETPKSFIVNKLAALKFNFKFAKFKLEDYLFANEYIEMQKPKPNEKNEKSAWEKIKLYATSTPKMFYFEIGANGVLAKQNWDIDTANLKFKHIALTDFNAGKSSNKVSFSPELKFGYMFGNFDLSVGISKYQYEISKQFNLESDLTPFVVDRNYGILAYKIDYDSSKQKIYKYVVNNQLISKYNYVKIPLELKYNFKIGSSLSLQTGIGTAFQVSNKSQISAMSKYSYAPIEVSDSTPIIKSKNITDARLYFGIGYALTPKTTLLFSSKYSANLQAESRPMESLFNTKIRTWEFGFKLRYAF